MGVGTSSFNMGACGSKGGSSKVYAATLEDPLVTDVREKIAERDDGGKGCPVAKLNEVLTAIGAEALAPDEAVKAVAAIDASGSGYMSANAFLEWFQTHPDDAGADAPPMPEVHESVRRGLKDDGEACGTGGYDDDLLTQPAENGGER